MTALVALFVLLLISGSSAVAQQSVEPFTGTLDLTSGHPVLVYTDPVRFRLPAQRLDLLFVGAPPGDLVHGSVVRVTGVRVKMSVLVQTFSVQARSAVAYPPGPYTITDTVTRAEVPGESTSASAIYTLVDAPPPPPPGTCFDDFHRLDSPTLDNGWAQVAGTLSIFRNPQFPLGAARSGTVKALNLAVGPIIGATQKVQATFVPLMLDAPRFMVVTRYNLDRTYYACYRNTGGSAQLVISKFIGGVEQRLKVVSLGNPARNVPFTLICEAVGSLITARVGTLSTSAVDTSIASGSPGFGIWYTGVGAAAPQAITEFSATVQ